MVSALPFTGAGGVIRRKCDLAERLEYQIAYPGLQNPSSHNPIEIRLRQHEQKRQVDIVGRCWPIQISRYKQEQQRELQQKEKTDEICSYID